MENVVDSKSLCFNKSFERKCAISTGIPNLRVWWKNWSNWNSGVGQKIRPLVMLEMDSTRKPRTPCDLESATMPRTPQLVFTLTARSALMLWWQNIKQRWTSLLSTDPLLDFFSNLNKTWQWLSRLFQTVSLLAQWTSLLRFQRIPQRPWRNSRGEKGRIAPWQAKCKNRAPT